MSSSILTNISETAKHIASCLDEHQQSCYISDIFISYIVHSCSESNANQNPIGYIQTHNKITTILKPRWIKMSSMT
jgi:hypothetical protein